MRNKPVIWFKQFIDSDGIKIVTKVLDAFAVRGKYDAPLVASATPREAFSLFYCTPSIHPLRNSSESARSTSTKEQEELSECIGIFKDVMNQKVRTALEAPLPASLSISANSSICY